MGCASHDIICQHYRGHPILKFVSIEFIMLYFLNASFGVEAGIMAVKSDLVHIFSRFLIISYSKRHLCPLQLLSYAFEISCPSWSYSSLYF